MVTLRYSALLAMIAVVVGAFALGGATSPAEYRCPKCNVILISIDTLRADHLGAYGYQRPTSPHVDSLREEAVLFSTAIAQAPSTAASHGAMLTSLVPSSHGALFSRRSALTERYPTLAEVLRERGFRTASFNGGGQIIDAFGFGRGFEVYTTIPGKESLNDRFIDQVEGGIAWMEQHRNEQFFLFLHSYEAHQPYGPRPEHLALFRPVPYTGSIPTPIFVRVLLQINAGQRRMSADDRQFIIDNYDAEIRSVDEGIGRLVEYLKTSGLFESSMVVFTSDHGEEFGEHGKMGMHSHTLYDELLKVPLVIKFPHQQFAGGAIGDQVRSVDIMPTVLDLLDLPRPAHLQGSSLMPLVQGESPGDEFRYAFSQRDSKRGFPTAVRTKRWKAHKRRLFNLENDPGELVNVVEQYPEVNAELVEAAEGVQRESDDDSNSKTDLDSETLEQLKTLGYLQ